ncbi:hypothetical protein G6F68_020374 [Rhizopus microsporus]|nr:hypothetical protein G6F68_020374 [Rhizopus microsporus]
MPGIPPLLNEENPPGIPPPKPSSIPPNEEKKCLNMSSALEGWKPPPFVEKRKVPPPGNPPKPPPGAPPSPEGGGPPLRPSSPY